MSAAEAAPPPRPGNDPDDEVLAELDVIVHHDLDGRVHLLQHPLRPAYRAPGLPVAARLRAHRNVLELDYAVEPDGDHFDPMASQGAQA